MPTELIVNHNAGFFSCCSVRLTEIINFFNKHEREPITLDCSTQFHNYKVNPADPLEDLNHFFFKQPHNQNIEFKSNIDFNWEYQFQPYFNLNYESLTPFIKKYFEPSDYVKKILLDFENEKKIEYENTVGVCYRGNDKHTETRIASHESFIDKCGEIFKKNPNIRFFIQTDEIDFLKSFLSKFPNSFFNEIIPTINFDVRGVVHNFIEHTGRSQFGANFLSSIISLSKCKFLITHSGNCGMWITLYRGNSLNVYQYLNHGNCNFGWLNK
jgi:hypothetical protein